MPYTPPSARSPAVSGRSSPNTSRRRSFEEEESIATPTRPTLPRSSSYLAMHRRVQSAMGIPTHHLDHPTPVPTSEDLQPIITSSSVRQSPPPITDRLSMPKGAVVSPPESDDDDDLPQMRRRRIDNLKELHDAISQIPQHRSSSPSKDVGPRNEAPDAGDLILPSQAAVMSEGMHHIFSIGALDKLAVGSRRVSHQRSVTEPNVLHSKSAGNSLAESEDDSEDELPRQLSMVRKKSGELVRPALRPTTTRRPSSMPGTPTFSKAVHFDSNLEHVRHFLQVDRPLAVSAGSSPVENHDIETEYPFMNNVQAPCKSPLFEWEIIMNNFPVESPDRKRVAVRLERVWMSNEQKSLFGSVIVANIAFQKSVTCRFTFDYWKTTSEISAEYNSVLRPEENQQSHDRFTFTIKLSDLANLETKTLFFCIRYNVAGQEHWDNNGGINFQADFRKKMKPIDGNKGFIGDAARPAKGLPRSNRRPTGTSIVRPESMFGMDEFGGGDKLNKFDQSIHDYLGETGLPIIRLKTPKNLLSDKSSNRLSTPNTQAFANRYDFSASLSAEIMASPVKSGRKSPVQATDKSAGRPKDSAPAVETVLTATTSTLIPGTGSPSAILASTSYEELVNKYCFFGTKPANPQLRNEAYDGRYDGVESAMAIRGSSSSVCSLTKSPLTFEEPVARPHVAQPPPSRPINPVYISQSYSGASPAESTVKTLAMATYQSSAGASRPPFAIRG